MRIQERLEEFVRLYREKANKKQDRETYPLFTDKSPYIKNPLEMYKVLYDKSIDYYKKRRSFSEYALGY